MHFLGGLAITGREGGKEGGSSSLGGGSDSGDGRLVTVTGGGSYSKKRRARAKEGEGEIIPDFGEGLMIGWLNGGRGGSWVP